MARIEFSDYLLAFTEGNKVVHVTANSYKRLVAELENLWPGLAEKLERTAVAIDGQIYQDAWLEPIEVSSEVFFLQRIEGG